jgi:hypothetical protein
MIRFWKRAVVLLLAIIMVCSSIAIADTKINKFKIESISNHESSNIGVKDCNIVWDNIMDYAGGHIAMWDESDQYDYYQADDFHFDENTEVMDVHWIGSYWGDDYQSGDFNWCISFMYDDGTELEPDSHPQTPSFAGPFLFSWDNITKTLLLDTGDANFWEFSVYLPDSLLFKSSDKYWISIWGEGESPPRSCWGFHMSPIILSKTVWGSDKYGISFWTPGFNVVGYDHDQCFQLTNCEASIDVEKYVLYQKNQEWIDADEESTAIDLPICTDAKFKIVIHNDGNTNLYDIIVKDKMHESLKFITGEPLPDQWYYESPFYYLEWLIPGPLEPSETIEITITAHVEGPTCSFDYNYVSIETDSCRGILFDEDYAWVHAYEKSKTINMLFIKFLQIHPNIFSILRHLFGL